MKHIYLFILIVVLASIFPLLTQASGLAGEVIDNYRTVEKTVIGETVASSPTTIVIEIIKIALGVLGMLFVILIIWSGFQWMTAGGNTEIITKARQRIINAVIGLVIVLAAFGITEFVLDKIIMAVE